MRIVRATILSTVLTASCVSRDDRTPDAPALASAGHVPPLMVIAEPRADSARCAALRPTDALGTSRAGFIHEALDARATPRTPRFDDYHKDSYHVEKRDVAVGLVEVSRACGLPLRGVAILGPVGPLWAYYVLTFLQEGPTAIRVNELVMPHARITDKATGTIAPSAFDSIFRALAEAPLVEPRARPREARPDTSALGREFGYDFLLLRVVGDSLAQWSAVVTQNPDTIGARRTLESINGVLSRLAPTYPDSAARARRDRDT